MGGGKGVVRTNEGKRTKRGTKIGGNIIEIVWNRPPNLVFPLAQVRARVKVASRRGLFVPFAWAEVSENNRLSSFFLYFFLLFFFFTGILADTLCPQAITESSSKRNVSEFFLPLFFFFSFWACYFFFLFFFFETFAVQTAGERNWKRGESCSPPERKEIRGEEERFAEEREREGNDISSESHLGNF